MLMRERKRFSSALDMDDLQEAQSRLSVPTMLLSIAQLMAF